MRYQSLEEHFGRLLKSREWCAGVARFCASLLRTTELVDELHHLAKHALHSCDCCSIFPAADTLILNLDARFHTSTRIEVSI